MSFFILYVFGQKLQMKEKNVLIQIITILVFSSFAARKTYLFKLLADTKTNVKRLSN